MFFANAEAPYTNRSALQLSTISPTRKMTMFKSTTTCNRKYFARLSQKECHLPMLAAFYFRQILSIDVNFRRIRKLGRTYTHKTSYSVSVKKQQNRMESMLSVKIAREG
ncbi:uncharacterized protein METZ01_LOCUS490608 [marine metagenome]|uniref:Uncharacterized protein n=1 Tax=marine metagenome TaxID=408172 RepID=A0A383D0B6_9ZZZZ